MQANASSKMARKEWRVLHLAPAGAYLLQVAVRHNEAPVWHHYQLEVTGASQAYLEAVIEELNIQINAAIYNLGSIQRVQN